MYSRSYNLIFLSKCRSMPAVEIPYVFLHFIILFSFFFLLSSDPITFFTRQCIFFLFFFAFTFFVGKFFSVRENKINSFWWKIVHVTFSSEITWKSNQKEERINDVNPLWSHVIFLFHSHVSFLLGSFYREKEIFLFIFAIIDAYSLVCCAPFAFYQFSFFVQTKKKKLIW